LSLRIRRERPGDFAALHELVDAAFETAPHADGDEADYVTRLRTSDGYVPELALVAERDGELIGHIMLVRFAIEVAGGSKAALLLSPLSVAPPRQQQGVGTRLARAAMSRAAALGHDAVVVVGNPEYYSRFGFRCSRDFGVVNRDGFADVNVMAVELVPGALAGLEGSVTFPT